MEAGESVDTQDLKKIGMMITMVMMMMIANAAQAQSKNTA